MLNRKSQYKLLYIAVGIILLIAIVFVNYRISKRENFLHWNNKVYIYEIADKEIRVRGLPDKMGFFTGSYVINMDQSLIISDLDGEKIDVTDLKVGDLLIFDFMGEREPSLKDGESLNKGIQDIRLSDEPFNYKFWGIDLDNIKEGEERGTNDKN